MSQPTPVMTDPKRPHSVVSRIDHVFNKQTEYALKLRASSLEERTLVLKRLLKVVEKYTPNIIDAGIKDFNRPEAETLSSEVFPVIHEIKHAIKHLKKWSNPKKISATKLTFGTKSKVVYEPKGVCLIISPWNYPANLTFGPLASALAAGNTAIIKPSELTPSMSKVISSIVTECFDEKYVSVFTGEVEVSISLLEKPFHHIFFTGSPQVGKLVMAAAAKHLSSVTLELGGKSPVIVDETINLDKTAAKIAWGKYTNSGQTCIAPDYVLVQEDQLQALVSGLQTAITQFYGDDIKGNPDFGRIVNLAHTKRIKSLINEATEKGGEIVFGGDVDETQHYISPTLLVGDFTSSEFLNSRLMQEEIFGPVLPILAYRDLGEAVTYINKLPKPLALYLYSDDRATVDSVIEKTSAGGTCINTNLVHFIHSHLPFGGINNSGIGHAHGEYGFKAFSHERAVLEDKFSFNHLLYPPYTSKVKLLLKFLIKYVS